MYDIRSSGDRPHRIGSLFSGYGGLNLAVEHHFNAETIWYSELNEHVARVFSHHWPDAPNLGDISTIDWSTVPPVDILCGGFPCQDVSTVGKQAGIAPGTRSGLWSFMAAAIEALQPRYVVIENVRGLLSTSAVRAERQGATRDGRNPPPATLGDAIGATAIVRNLESDRWSLGDESARPLRALGAVLGDLADLRLHAQWIGLPSSMVGAPHHRFRIFITARTEGALPDAAGFGLLTRRGDAGSGEGAPGNDRPESSDHRLRSARAAGSPARWNEPEALFALVEGIFIAGGDTPTLSPDGSTSPDETPPGPAILNEDRGPRPAPEFVEWLMGLPAGWVTDPARELTANQQNTALGNGVLPLQAVLAMDAMS